MNEYTPAPVHINSSWVNLNSRPFTHIPFPIHKQNLLTWSLEYDHYLAALFQLPEPPSPPQCMIAIASNWSPSYPPRHTSLKLKGMSLFKMALQHPIITHGGAPPFHHCENCPRPPHCSHISLLPVSGIHQACSCHRKPGIPSPLDTQIILLPLYLRSVLICCHIGEDSEYLDKIALTGLRILVPFPCFIFSKDLITIWPTTVYFFIYGLSSPTRIVGQRFCLYHCCIPKHLLEQCLAQGKYWADILWDKWMNECLHG